MCPSGLAERIHGSHERSRGPGPRQARKRLPRRASSTILNPRDKRSWSSVNPCAEYLMHSDSWEQNPHQGYVRIGIRPRSGRSQSFAQLSISLIYCPTWIVRYQVNGRHKFRTSNDFAAQLTCPDAYCREMQSKAHGQCWMLWKPLDQAAIAGISQKLLNLPGFSRAFRWHISWLQSTLHSILSGHYVPRRNDGPPYHRT